MLTLAAAWAVSATLPNVIAYWLKTACDRSWKGPSSRTRIGLGGQERIVTRTLTPPFGINPDFGIGCSDVRLGPIPDSFGSMAEPDWSTAAFIPMNLPPAICSLAPTMSPFSDQERTSVNRIGATPCLHHAAAPDHRNRKERFQWLKILLLLSWPYINPKGPGPPRAQL